ncbi:HIT-like domain-containing protein [Podospora appendiculata]|uniref:Aprataxin-like protein n=1 Tax=Podospora appendiculata TaxID=314037 RepID=A0AAE0X815_9PEZI|nr:HIT-like domain-containing protein [Podospora appendiculata]
MASSRSDPTKGAMPPSPAEHDDGTQHEQGASSSPPSPPASSSQAPPPQPPPPPDPTKKNRNAFLELMSPKHHKAAKTAVAATDPHSHAAAKLKKGPWRGALLHYVQRPESFPSSQILRTTPNIVLIQDAFPKATIHLLLLPRSPAHYEQHPHEALADPAFLATVKDEAASAARIAAAELARRLSPFSASSRARNDAIAAGSIPFDELPPAGRDYLAEIRVGVHAHPSMAHLHVHIISRDMHSDRLKHRKHYNSFNTPFFVPLDDYPLAEDDKRRDPAFQNANLGRDLVCWACGKGFGSKFAELKRHLDDEFEIWKKR